MHYNAEFNPKNATQNAESAKRVTTQSVMVNKVQAQIDTANARLKALEAEEAGVACKNGPNREYQ